MSVTVLPSFPSVLLPRVTTKDTGLCDDNVIKRRSPSSITESRGFSNINRFPSISPHPHFLVYPITGMTMLIKFIAVELHFHFLVISMRVRGLNWQY